MFKNTKFLFYPELLDWPAQVPVTVLDANQTLSTEMVSVWCLFIVCDMEILAKCRDYRDSHEILF
jgi:hypothetical protein